MKAEQIKDIQVSVGCPAIGVYVFYVDGIPGEYKHIEILIEKLRTAVDVARAPTDSTRLGR